jgi:hypothetical protein
MLMLTVGDTVDLHDQNFGWRGAYTITKDYGDGKMQIVNTATKSKQVVSMSRLRRGRLAPFFIKSLKP